MIREFRILSGYKIRHNFCALGCAKPMATIDSINTISTAEKLFDLESEQLNLPASSIQFDPIKNTLWYRNSTNLSDDEPRLDFSQEAVRRKFIEIVYGQLSVLALFTYTYCVAIKFTYVAWRFFSYADCFFSQRKPLSDFFTDSDSVWFIVFCALVANFT